MIPIGKVDQVDGELLRSLQSFAQDAELIVVSGRAPSAAEQNAISQWRKFRWVRSEWGRALQLNAACRAASGQWIWMLHVDSTLDDIAIQSVRQKVATTSSSLYYFSLRFRGDGPIATQLNAIAANLRSKCLKMPFGDQGFLLMKSSLSSLGWMRTDCAYGEDHDFVWRMRIRGRKIECLPGTVATSARKYAKHGWGKTTRDHVVKTIRQALPLWVQLCQARLGISRATTVSFGVAAFVKTVGFSPLKTRLAASSSRELADQFYKQSVRAVGEWLNHCATGWGASTYWALAENPCLVGWQWSGHDLLAQGSGGLGERLHLVYEQLLRQHSVAVIVGTDSPQLSDELKSLTTIFEHQTCVVLGRCPDGGFYLVAGNVAIPRWVWTSVTYSAAATCDELIGELKSLNIKVETLPMLNDVDEYADLAKVAAELRLLPSMTGSQRLLSQWFRTVTNL